MRLSTVVSLCLLAVCAVLALPVTRTPSNALSLSSRSPADDGCDSEFCLLRRARTKSQKARSAARSVARKSSKSSRASSNKAAGHATQKSKSKSQVKADRKTRKAAKKEQKASKAAKAKAKPGHKSHAQKTKDNKGKVTFSKGAEKRMDGMGLHGKDRKKAKKYHKDVMKKEMKKNGASKGKVVATAHKGGTVKNEKNHITAQFKDDKGRNIPSKWTNSKGETKTGDKDLHHVYPDAKKKVPSGYQTAVNKSNYRQAANDAAAKGAERMKVKEDQAKGEQNKANREKMTDEEKKAQRKAQRDAKKKGKKKDDESG